MQVHPTPDDPDSDTRSSATQVSPTVVAFEAVGATRPVEIPHGQFGPLVDAIDAWAARLEGGADDLPEDVVGLRDALPRTRAAERDRRADGSPLRLDAVAFVSLPGPVSPSAAMPALVGYVLDACGAFVARADEHFVDSLTGDAERAGKLGLAGACLVRGEQGAAEVAPAAVKALKRVECLRVFA